MSNPVDPFRLLLEGIADYAIFLVDLDGRISRWSSSARKLFGYDADDIQGQPLSCLDPRAAAAHPATREELEWAAAHGRFEDVAWRLRHDQSTFWADSVITPLRDEQGELQGFSVIVRDITERKKAEEALRQKEAELSQARKMEAVGRLAGGIAHDFNNFITGIVGLADEVRQSMTEHDPRRSDLNDIIKTADQARMLTRELLAFGRRQVSTPQVLNINTVLNEKQKLFSRLLGADIQLGLRLDPAIRHILIDPMQLDQILINLVLNARDAMSEGGILKIETQLVESPSSTGLGGAGPWVRVVIADTGCGMDEAVLAHLFEPFFTTKEHGKGTGLGLATVYGIVTQNHGSISVTSHPGKGTTFYIEFPEIDAPIKIQPKPTVLTMSQGSETILVVEDTEVVRRVVIRALTKAGYHVLTATSGMEALELARQHKESIHLVLTDVVMPGINGTQMVERLRLMHSESAVLFMSAYAEDFIQQRGPLHAESDFIEKPFTNASLLLKVREVLDHRATRLANLV